MARALLTSILLLSVAAITASVPADGPPPRNLQKVGDHWTAWQPPADAPPGSRVHVIEPGDTLWDLAARFYNNPYLWPQIWELNQYIQDAHWIYPGDPLVIGVEAVTPEELAEQDEGEDLEGEEEGEEDDTVAYLTLDEALGSPEPLGINADLYCSGYIDELDKSFGYRITGSEHQALFPRLKGTGVDTGGELEVEEGEFGPIEVVRFGLSVGDIVYLDGGRQAGLTPGQLFDAVEARETVRHPVTGEVFGRFYLHLGRVRVLTVQEDSAIAEISEGCRPITLGTVLEPYEPEPIPLGRMSEPRPAVFPTAVENLTDAPVILHALDDAFSLGQNHIVFLDQGETSDLVPGDIFTIYRLNAPGHPPVVLGELAVLAVQRRAAVARILDSRYPIYVGDRLELK